MTGRDEFKLICDPFFAWLPPSQQNALSPVRTYDLRYLGKKTKGKWRFCLTLEGEGDDVTMVVQQWRSYKRKRRLPWKPMDTLRLPLYFANGSNTVHVGARDKDLEELGLNLPEDPDEGDDGDESNEGNEND